MKEAADGWYLNEKVESILSQIRAGDIVRKHLKYSIHQDTPVTWRVSGTCPFVTFEAVVSADHRLEGAFRWHDDSWVRVIESGFGLLEEEITRSRGTATQIIYARVHQCGVEMQSQVPQYVEVAAPGDKDED